MQMFCVMTLNPQSGTKVVAFYIWQNLRTFYKNILWWYVNYFAIKVSTSVDISQKTLWYVNYVAITCINEFETLSILDLH